MHFVEVENSSPLGGLFLRFGEVGVSTTVCVCGRKVAWVAVGDMGVDMGIRGLANFETRMASKCSLSASFYREEDFGALSRLAMEHPGVPADILKELTEAFQFFDLNGDGKISKEELGSVVRSLGEKITDEGLDRLVKEVDADGDGYINLHEFIELNTRAMQFEVVGSTDEYCRRDAALVSAFNVFDLDKNGVISAEELHRVLVGFGDKKISLQDCRSMINVVDEDGDQMVNFREFQFLMQKGISM